MKRTFDITGINVSVTGNHPITVTLESDCKVSVGLKLSEFNDIMKGTYNIYELIENRIGEIDNERE